LIIVTEGKEEFKKAVSDHVNALNRNDIKLVYLIGNNYTLGMLRNISMEAAGGDIICQWDDDDVYHPERLATQVECMLQQQGKACFFTDQLSHFSSSNKLHWVDWSSRGKRTSIIPGTVMMFKDARFRYPEAGPFAKAGEDMVFLRKIMMSLKIARLSNRGYLYVYTFHGKNTYQLKHHQGLIKEFGCVSHTRALEWNLRTAMGYYAFDTPYCVHMQGKKITFPEKEPVFPALSKLTDLIRIFQYASKQ
jgi:glycosyltransferase involved in cell wall biosynthesis